MFEVPITRLTTLHTLSLQSAMARSVLVPSSDDDILTDLDARYFTEDFDAVAFLLVSMSPCHKL